MSFFGANKESIVPFFEQNKESIVPFLSKTKSALCHFGAKQRELCVIFGAKVSIENNLLFGTTCFEKSGSNLRKESL